MAVLGYEGRLSLLREAPDPILLGPQTLNRRTNSLEAIGSNFWSGDEVTLFCEGGLPTDRNPEGMAQYGDSSQWVIGETREHIVTDNDAFYRADDDVFFYEQFENDPVQRRLFIHVDQLGRLSFYRDQADALVGSLQNRFPIGSYDWGAVLIHAAGTADYNNAVLSLYGQYDWADYSNAVIGEKTLSGPWIDAPNWKFVCDLTSWDIETDAAAIDTTPIGVKFGDAVKSLVRASGSFDFYVDRRETDWDGSKLLQLILLLERGCKAKAQFWMIVNRSSKGCKGLLPGDLYYEADILLVSGVVSVRLDEAITGSARFMTTEDVALKMGGQV